jgi:hypothetical protein
MAGLPHITPFRAGKKGLLCCTLSRPMPDSEFAGVSPRSFSVPISSNELGPQSEKSLGVRHGLDPEAEEAVRRLRGNPAVSHLV